MTVYVMCPAGLVGPGPEALHQFAHHALELGYDAKIFYYGETGVAATPSLYRGYKVEIAQSVADDDDTIMVAPEVVPEFLLNIQKGRRVMWWLSVDRFDSVNKAVAGESGTTYGRLPLDYVYDPRLQIVHVAQSEYARLNLFLHDIQARMVGGYIDATQLRKCRSFKGRMKQERVAYTPGPNNQFQSALVEATRDFFKWVSTEGVYAADLAELLGTSKVYADFGDHSGLPLIPMLAASAGCVVVSGSRGAAANLVDMPIKRKFIVNEATADSMARIVVLIAKALADYRPLVAEFGSYVRSVERLEATFVEQLSTLLSELNAPRLSLIAS